MSLQVFTIGVYGYDEPHFFQSLLDARIDLLVDIRRRRALRDSQYAFANSQRLQQRLAELEIPYSNYLALAPSNAARQVQTIYDRLLGISKRERQRLAPDFIAAYRRECLQQFDAQRFLDLLGTDHPRLAFLCVECQPAACHRSLVAEHFAVLGAAVTHLVPS